MNNLKHTNGFLKEQDQIKCNHPSVEHIEQEEKCFALLHARIE